MFTSEELREAERAESEAYEAYYRAKSRADMIRQTLHSEFMRRFHESQKKAEAK